MQKYFAVVTFILLIVMVLIRLRLLKSKGIDAFLFGKLDKKDFLIPPFVFIYIYIIVARAFDFPLIRHNVLFHSEMIAWAGVVFCLAGLILFFWSLISFGQSFRVGIDTDKPDKLVTTRAFAFSRNPIYVAFASVLIGQFLIFPHWILIIYLCVAFWLFHKQVLLEEDFLAQYYGDEFGDYCLKVRRYF